MPETSEASSPSRRGESGVLDKTNEYEKAGYSGEDRFGMGIRLMLLPSPNSLLALSNTSPVWERTTTPGSVMAGILTGFLPAARYTACVFWCIL